MQRYLDQDLDELEYNQLLGHLKQCPDCTELFQRLNDLSNELENLPKVTPAFSLVDAILPQLQNIQPLSIADPMSASLASEAMESPQFQNENVTVTELTGRRSKMRGYVSAKIVGGVVAAGLLLGFFVFEQQQQQSGMNNAGDIASSSNAERSSDTKASSPSSKMDSNTAKNAVPASPSASSSQLDSQPTNENKPLGSSKDLIPPSNVPIPQVAPGAASTSGKAGASLPAAPSASNNGAQTTSSVVPQSPNGGFGNLQEPMTFGARSSSSHTADPAASTSNSLSSPIAPPSTSAGSAQTLVPGAASEPTPVEQQPKDKAAPANPSESPASSSKIQPNGMGFSIMKSAVVNSSTSPDGAYRASVNEKRQVVITDKAGAAIFTGLSWAETDAVSLIDWSSDNKQLNYQVSSQSGTTSYVINLISKTEMKK